MMKQKTIGMIEHSKMFAAEAEFGIGKFLFVSVYVNERKREKIGNESKSPGALRWNDLNTFFFCSALMDDNITS